MSFYELRWSEHFCFSEIFQSRRWLPNFRELFMFGGDFGAETSKLSPEIIFWASSLKLSVWHPHVVVRRSVSMTSGHPMTFTLAKFFKIGDHLPPEKPPNVNNSLIFWAAGPKFFLSIKLKNLYHSDKFRGNPSKTDPAPQNPIYFPRHFGKKIFFCEIWLPDWTAGPWTLAF